MSSGDGPAKAVFTPADPPERLRGWLLHAHKVRDRHDSAARRCDARRYWVGGPAVVCAAAAGALAPVSATAAGVAGVAAAALTAVQTLFDYPGRAERHRLAATKFKALIRELEQALTGAPPADPSDEWVTDLRRRLDGLEEIAPVVSQDIIDRVEARYREVVFVGRVLDLVGPPAGGRP